MDPNERDLVERAKTDPEAFGALYDRYVDDIQRYVCARLHNATAAEDVTADVFFNALRAMPRYQDRGLPFSCWLFRIAANAIASYHRREPAHAEVGEDFGDPAASVESVALRNLELAGLWHLVRNLPPQQQQAMRLRFQDDRSARDVARILRKSEEAVKLLTYRAISRLRSELGVLPGVAPAPSAPSAM